MQDTQEEIIHNKPSTSPSPSRWRTWEYKFYILGAVLGQLYMFYTLYKRSEGAHFVVTFP